MTTARAAAYKVFAVIDRKPRVQPGTKKPSDVKGKIEFSDLTFRYPSRYDNPVFRDMDLSIEAGKTTALVGLSGCGKSSIVGIVERFYEPASGYYEMVLEGGRTKPYPYETNLMLLEARAKGDSEATVSLPLTSDGKLQKKCRVSLGTSKHEVLDADGAVRNANGTWYWVEREGKGKGKEDREEYEFPLEALQKLAEGVKQGADAVEVEMAFGRFSVNLKTMQRSSVPMPVAYAKNGRVTVDGTDLGDLDLEWWRDQVGIVTQEPVLFVGTILDNIRMGRPDATLEEVKAACRKAHIHHVIERWPDAYDTKVGEGGSQLSGGQKQRIAIARAIVKRPKILLLDEATSALDRASEIQVQKALDRMFAQHKKEGATGTESPPTTIVIAHRLQTVMRADKIIVMKPPSKGSETVGAKIVETGTHKELLAIDGGHYASLWKMQNRTEPKLNTKPDGEEDDHHYISDDDASSQVTSLEDEQQLGYVKTADEKAKEEKKRKEAKVKENSSLGRVAKLAAPWNLWLIPGILGSVMNGAMYPVYCIIFVECLEIFRKLQNNEVGTATTTLVFEDVDRSDVDIWAWLFIAVGGMALIGTILQVGCFGFMGAQLTHRIRKMLFAHILSQDMGFFDEADHESGALAALLAGKTEVINTLFGPTIGMILRTLCCIGIAFSIAFSQSWKLTLVLLSAVPGMMVGGFINVLIMGEGFEGEAKGTGGRIASEGIANVKTVHAFNHAGAMQASYRAVAKAELKKKNFVALGLGAGFGITQMVMFGAMSLGLWYGGRLMRDGEIDFKEMMITVMEVIFAAMGVGESLAMMPGGADAKEAAADVFEILDREPAVDQMSNAGARDVLSSGVISFENISFWYPTRPDIQILKNLSLKIEEPGAGGMQVGLIGGTGSGKSTIIQLLQRFYRIGDDCGRITVDGTDLSTVDLQWWRTQVAVVSQEPTLFATTVAENIRLGKRDATMEEVIEAAKKANIHKDIDKLPDGYETNVGAKGNMLSGGQKQRVAIARAILKRPKILVLDEATSALDNESERIVQQALDEIIAEGSMTTITIAHKLTTIRNCDKIAVLDLGNLIEQGSHDELMQIDGGDYKARYNLYHSLDTEGAPY